MPTISQLAPAGPLTAADKIPISQSGYTRSISVGDLSAGAQAAITAPTGSLLGRISLGPGGPEAVTVGTGLSLQSGAISANGADHAGFPLQTTLHPTDSLVLSSGGVPSLMPIDLLRGLFSAGSNVTIDSSGTISATASALGTPGPAGPQGPAGPRGATGPQGPSGATGLTGLPGSAGPAGATGLQGAVGPAGAAGAQGPSGPAGAPGLQGAVGPAGPTGPPGTIGPSGPQGLIGPQGSIGLTGSAGATGATGAIGPTGPRGATGPAGLSTSITTAPVVSSVGAGDLIGISQGGADHSIAYSALLNGRLITDVTNPVAVPMSDTDQLWVGQNANGNLTVGTLLQVYAYLQTKPRRRVDELATTNLTFVRHHRALVAFPNGGTVSVTTPGDCGDGFECEVLNTSGTTLTIAPTILCSGQTSLSPNQATSIRGVGGVVYAQTPSALTSSPGISIGTIRNPLAAATFSVTGTLAGYSLAPPLSYSDDGVSWLSLPVGAAVSSSSFSFTHPALTARVGGSLYLKDGNGLIQQSNTFNVESAAFGTLPSFTAGQSASVSFSLAGLTSAWIVWWSPSNGNEVGSRTAIASSPTSIVAPAAAATYTLRIFDAATGGLVLGESAQIAVASVSSETISVVTPNNNTSIQSVAVSGTYANGTPTALDWSTDGVAWTAVSTAVISGGVFSFSIPAGVVAAGGPYTIRIRDRSQPGVVGRAAGTFNVENASLSAVPSAATAGGSISGVVASLTGLSVAYATLSASGAGSADIGMRIAFSGTSLPTLSVSSPITTSIRLYDAPSAGNLIIESANISINSASGLPGIAGPVMQVDASMATSLFADAARTTTQAGSGGTVQGLADLSGNGNHLAQTTTNLAPILSLNSQNGKPGLRFTGTAAQFLKQLSGATWMSGLQASSATYLLVFKPATIDASTHAAFGVGNSAASDGHNALSFAIGGTSYVAAARNTSTSYNSVHATGFNTANTLLKVVCRVDATGSAIYTLIKSAAETATAITGALTGTTWDTFELGSSLPSFFLDGWVYEFALWNTFATTAQRDSLLSYATAKWGS